MPLVMVLCIVAWWIACFGGYLIYPYRIRAWIFAWSLILMVCFYCVGMRYWAAWYPVVVLKQDGIVRFGPDLSYGMVETVAAHEAVRVADCRNGWYKITKNGRSIGWIPIDTVGISSREIR